jgi:hypothetical protein
MLYAEIPRFPDERKVLARAVRLHLPKKLFESGVDHFLRDFRFYSRRRRGDGGRDGRIRQMSVRFGDTGLPVSVRNDAGLFGRRGRLDGRHGSL